MTYDEIPEGCNIVVIPDKYRTNESYEMTVLRRGNLCYLLKNESRNNYRVQERVIVPSNAGFTEMLYNVAQFAAFKELKDAQKHFEKVEAGHIEIMPFI